MNRDEMIEEYGLGMTRFVDDVYEALPANYHWATVRDLKVKGRYSVLDALDILTATGRVEQDDRNVSVTRFKRR